MRLLKEIRNLLDSYPVKSGIYHYYRGEIGPASEFLRRALDDDAGLSESERRVARYYLTMTLMESAERREDRGDLDAALAEYERAIEVSSDYSDIRFRFAGALDRAGRTEDALAQYRAAVERNPDYLDAWIALGFALTRAGRPADAAEAFGKACEIKVRSTREPFDRGVARLRAGDRDGAAIAFHEAFVFVPKLFEARYRAALRRMKAEQFEEALREIDAAIEQNPLYPDLHNFRGVCLCETGDLAAGIASFARAAELNPRFTVPRLNLAFALVRDGRLREGEAELQRVLEDEPTNSAARAKLAEIRSGAAGPEKRRSVSRGGGAR